MKRLTAIILSVCMLLTLLPAAVFAAGDDEGLKKAILTVKERIEIPEKYSEFTSETTAAEGVTYYYLTWSVKEDEFGMSDSIWIEISDRGDILSYQRNNRLAHSGADKRFSKFTGEEMRDMAYAWLDKVNPSVMAEFPIEKAEYPKDCNVYPDGSVSFKRMMGGVPFCDDYFNLILDTQTGEVKSMYSSYTYYNELPDIKAVMEREKAEEKFWEQNPVSVRYTASGEKDASLVYEPQNGEFEMDALSGEEVKYEERNDFGVSGGGAAPEAKDEAESDRTENMLTESELKNIDQINGLLSKKELSDIAKGLQNTGFADAETEEVRYTGIKNGDKDEKYIASVGLKTKDGGAGVRLDARNGELISFYSYYNSGEEKTETIDKQTAEKNAAAFAEKYAAKEVSQCEIKKTDEEEKMPRKGTDRYVNFVRHANGIPYANNSINITVDAATGQIRQFYKNWTDEIRFEDPAELIGEDAAKAAFVGEDGLSLKYVNKRRGRGIGKITLAFELGIRPALIGGISGKPVGYDGRPIEDTKTEYIIPSDIEGHYAETAVTSLIRSGVLKTENESFRPDEVITQKELLKFVGGLAGGIIPYYMDDRAALKIAVRYGIFAPEDYQPEKEACRIDGAEYILHALGYADIAKLQGIYDSGFNDRELMGEKEGYAALAKGLGIVGGDENGCFCPYEPLTRADTAIMIYNYFIR